MKDTKAFSSYGVLIKNEFNKFVVNIDGQENTFEIKPRQVYSSLGYSYNNWGDFFNNIKEESNYDILKGCLWINNGWYNIKKNKRLEVYNGRLIIDKDGVKKFPQSRFDSFYSYNYFFDNDISLLKDIRDLKVIKSNGIKYRDAIRLIKDTAERLYKDSCLNIESLIDIMTFDIIDDTKELDNHIEDILTRLIGEQGM